MKTFARILDKLALWLAWRLPRRLVTHAFVRVLVMTTPGDAVLPKVTAMDALRRWEP
jgi:hypothetical protein